MFEDRIYEEAEQRSQVISALEKQTGSREKELLMAQEELAKRTDELKVVEMANTQAQSELVYMRGLVNDLNIRLKEAIEISMKDRIRANKMEIASFTAAEDWKVELEAMEKQNQAEISWLQKANEELKLELVAAINARDEAVGLARDAVLASKAAATQTEYLSSELGIARATVAISSQETKMFDQTLYEFAKQKEDLTRAYAVCHTAAQAGAAMVAEKEAELKRQIAASFQAKQQAEMLRWELFESRQNEMKLFEMDNELELLKEQLAVAKELEHQQAKVVLDTDAKLQEAYSELHQAKAAQTETATILTLVQVEAEEYQQKWKMACAEASTLMANLESTQNECKTQKMQLMKLQERESRACAQAADLEAMLLEVSDDLARAMAREQNKDESVNHLTSLLDEANLESQKLRQQLYEAVFEAQFKDQEAMFKSAEASTLMANLESTVNECKSQQMQLLKSQERESHACAQAADFEAMLLEASKDLARAIAREQNKDETLSHLTNLLDRANLEYQILRQQLYEAVFEAQFKAQEVMFKSETEAIEEVMSLQEVLKVAECIASETRVELQEMSNELRLARELAGKGSSVEHNITECASAGLGIATGANQHTMKDSFESIEVDLLQDQHSSKRTLTACQTTALRIASDLEVTREQLEMARAEAEMLKGAAFAAVSETYRAKQEREQAQMGLSAAREEILTEQEQVRVAREEALAVTAKLKQLQEKFTQASENASHARGEMQGKSRDLSEPWEIVESSSEAVVTIKQEEYDALKFKVHEAVESKSLIESEMLSLRCLNQRLSVQLDATNMEIKALRTSEQNTQQQYDTLQQGNMILEAEVQRLKGKGEQLLRAWEIGHEAYGSDTNALQSSQVIPLEGESQRNSLPHFIYRDLSSSQQEEEEESTEFLPISTKKKKALFLRIGTFITKKMN